MRSRIPVLTILLLAACAAAQTPIPISVVQGSGMASPYAGSIVTVRGVVTAVSTGGFFLQTPPGGDDGDPATSEGVYVYTKSSPAVTIGDDAEVTGSVSEFHGLTEIVASGAPAVRGHGVVLPAAVALGPELPSPAAPAVAEELERYEGMRVTLGDATVSGPSDRSGLFWVAAGPSRSYREPGAQFPGLPELPVWDGNPEILGVNAGRMGLAVEAVAGASAALAGSLGEFDGSYEIWPTAAQVGERTLPRPVRAGSTGTWRIGTQNLERLFDAVDDPFTDDDVPSAATVDARVAAAGAWIRDVLRAPDAVAVQEVENLPLLERVAAAASGGERTYRAILVEGADPSGIDVGLLVDTATEVVDSQAVGAGATFSLDGVTHRTFDRPPLVVRLVASGRPGPWALTVVAVHLRSLNGIAGNEGGFVRAKRRAEAVWVADLVNQIRASRPGDALIVIGDFNAFPFTDAYVDVIGQISGRPDPAGALLAADARVSPPLLDACERLAPAERYSFVERGSAEQIDHALLSAPAARRLADVEIARGNADAPETWTGRPGPVRVSDHDGLVITLSRSVARAPRLRIHP